MARLKASDADYKKTQGKELFVKGFNITNISEIIGIGEKTLGKWRKEGNWDEEKELQTLKPSNIKRLTLKCALAIKPMIFLRLWPPLTELPTAVKKQSIQWKASMPSALTCWKKQLKTKVKKEKIF